MSIKSKSLFVMRNSLVPLIGWEKWNRLQYRLLHRYWPNFRSPITFLEYLQWMKYYGPASELSPFVDKVSAKYYVSRAIGDDYVIPTLSVVRPGGAIDYDNLPDAWIAKSAHAAGWNYLHRGGAFSKKVVDSKVHRWLSKNYFDIGGENNYRYIPPKVLFEPLISAPNEDLVDYKIWCFKGAAVFIGLHGDRANGAKGEIFTLNFEATRLSYPDIKNWAGVTLPKPKQMEKLVSLAERLAEPFNFVRVDLYEVDNKIFFGELTFTPGDGLNIRIPYDEDLRLGELLKERSKKNIQVNYEILP